MIGPVRYVAPFRPMAAENDHHQALEGFDWIGAIRMLSASVERSCGASVEVLTDIDTTLPLPALQYRTAHRRLMLWSLEVCACYLESDDFDRDTVMLDCDQIVFADLQRWFAPYMDLGILARAYSQKDPQGFRILNGVQFWAHHGKARLAALFRRLLDDALLAPEVELRWGADTRVLERALVPLEPYDLLLPRAGVTVRFIPADAIIERFNAVQVRQLADRRSFTRTRPVLDFRNMQKRYMADAYAAMFGEVLA